MPSSTSLSFLFFIFFFISSLLLLGERLGSIQFIGISCVNFIVSISTCRFVDLRSISVDVEVLLVSAVFGGWDWGTTNLGKRWRCFGWFHTLPLVPTNFFALPCMWRFSLFRFLLFASDGPSACFSSFPRSSLLFPASLFPIFSFAYLYRYPISL